MKKTYVKNCLSCHTDIVLKHKPRLEDLEKPCRKCSNEKRKAMPRKVYTRTCEVCHETKESKYRMESNVCQKCTRKQLGSILIFHKDYNKRTAYTYFCPDCNSVRIIKSKRKSNYCSTHARKFVRIRQHADKIQFDFNDLKMKVLVSTNDCKPTVKVKKEVIKEQMKSSKKIKKVKVKSKRVKTKSTKSINPLALKKVREINRQHREDELKKETIVVQLKSDAQMIAEFLQTHEVKREVERPISEVAREFTYVTGFCHGDF